MTLLNSETPDGGYGLLDEVSAAFLRLIKQHYTRDAAVDAIDALTPILGKSWKGRLIYGIMTNEANTTGKVAFVMTDPTVYERREDGFSQKIMAIRAVRALGKIGLTEAKAMVEKAEKYRQTFSIRSQEVGESVPNWQGNILKAIKDLKDCGFVVEYT